MITRRWALSAGLAGSINTAPRMIATAYCDYGRTASGLYAGWGRVAAGPSVPFGTNLFIEGYGYAVVADRGGAIRDGMLDVWFPTYKQAINWGRRSVRVWFL